MTNDQTVVTDEMVTRFLSYKIPAYIEYTNGGNYSTSEARQMLEHVLGGEVAPQPMPAQAVEQERLRCASIADDECQIRERAGQMHPDNSDARSRCFAGAGAAANIAKGIRCGEVASHTAPVVAVEPMPSKYGSVEMQSLILNRAFAPIQAKLVQTDDAMSDDDVERLWLAAGWTGNRSYMTSVDYRIWCARMRKFAALASQTEPREIINSNPEIPDNSIDKAAEQAVAVEPTNREAAYESLLRAAAGQLRAWHQKYGNHAPSWLPPGGDVSLLETIDDWLETNTATTQPEPTLHGGVKS